jgi:hypothetical protein
MKLRSYTTYSVGAGLVWAARLALVTKLDPANKRRNYMVFAGFGIGWLSATIARYVYPPPKKYRLPEKQACCIM